MNYKKEGFRFEVLTENNKNTWLDIAKKCSYAPVNALDEFFLDEQLENNCADGNAIIYERENNIPIALFPGVVEKRKRTIAVLGTGLDEKSIYPQTNLDLSKKILEHNGCLISELTEGTPGSKFSFPKRNRIISGLSSAVLVIEAKEKSGSLITANYAIKQNKKLFAVPGSIYSLNSSGPNKLIKNGANLVENSQDILQELGILNLQKIKKDAIEGKNNEESLILQALSEQSLNIDKIIEKTKLNAPKVATTLAVMEISGKIRNLGGNVYAIG